MHLFLFLWPYLWYSGWTREGYTHKHKKRKAKKNLEKEFQQKKGGNLISIYTTVIYSGS